MSDEQDKGRATTLPAPHPADSLAGRRDDSVPDDSRRDEELIALAREARERAYAPYSDYLVGCGLRCDEIVFQGANIENASYGLTICAERVACTTAAFHGVRHIDAVAVVTTSSPPASPCGMCLQTLVEFSRDPATTRVLLVNTEGERRDFTLAELIPHAFEKSQLTS